MRPLVEIVRGPATSEATVAKAVAHVQALGRMPIVVQDGPGFVMNRILLAYLAAALGLLVEGVEIAQVEQAMRDFGMALGPLEMLDEIGLDTALRSGLTLAGIAGERHPGTEILVRLVKCGQLGCKTGAGFFRYPGKSINPSAFGLIAQCGQTARKEAWPRLRQWIIRRLLGPMVWEAVRLLAEGKVDDPRDIDLGVIFGLGFPTFRGGLLWWVDHCEADERRELLEGTRPADLREPTTGPAAKPAGLPTAFYTWEPLLPGTLVGFRHLDRFASRRLDDARAGQRHVGIKVENQPAGALDVVGRRAPPVILPVARLHQRKRAGQSVGHRVIGGVLRVLRANRPHVRGVPLVGVLLKEMQARCLHHRGGGGTRIAAFFQPAGPARQGKSFHKEFAMISQQVLEGNWNRLKGKIRQRWGQLTDSDLAQLRGNVDEMVGTIQQKTGETREAVEGALQEWAGSAGSAVGRAAEAGRQYLHCATDSIRGATRQAVRQVSDGLSSVTFWRASVPAGPWPCALGRGWSSAW